MKDKPLLEWAKILEDINIPQGETYGTPALLGIILAVIFPHWIADPLMFLIIVTFYPDNKENLYNKMVKAQLEATSKLEVSFYHF